MVYGRKKLIDWFYYVLNNSVDESFLYLGLYILKFSVLKFNYLGPNVGIHIYFNVR